MDGPHFGHRDGAVAAAAFLEFPKGERIPGRLLGGAVFEGTVLDQFGIKPAIGGVVQVLKEDAEQIGTDLLARPGGLNRDGRLLRVDFGRDADKQEGKTDRNELSLSDAIHGIRGPRGENVLWFHSTAFHLNSAPLLRAAVGRGQSP